MTVEKAAAVGGDAQYREALFWRPDIVVRETDAGVIYIRQKDPLPAYPDRLTEPLMDWAARTPDRTLYAARGPDGAWVRLSFAEALDRARSLGQFLLDAGLSPARPLVILSGNDLDHAALALAAIHVGIPYARSRRPIPRSRRISTGCAACSTS